jgi:hypothetical protein
MEAFLMVLVPALVMTAVAVVAGKYIIKHQLADYERKRKILDECATNARNALVRGEPDWKSHYEPLYKAVGGKVARQMRKQLEEL